MRANHSWSSFIYRWSEYKGFYESLQIAFPNNELASFVAEVYSTARHQSMWAEWSGERSGHISFRAEDSIHSASLRICGIG